MNVLRLLGWAAPCSRPYAVQASSMDSFIAAEGSRNSIPLSSDFDSDDDACVHAGQRPPPDTDGLQSPPGGCVPLAHANAVPIGCRPTERRSIARCGEEARDRASGGDAWCVARWRSLTDFALKKNLLVPHSAEHHFWSGDFSAGM